MVQHAAVSLWMRTQSISLPLGKGCFLFTKYVQQSQGKKHANWQIVSINIDQCLFRPSAKECRSLCTVSALEGLNLLRAEQITSIKTNAWKARR